MAEINILDILDNMEYSNNGQYYRRNNNTRRLNVYRRNSNRPSPSFARIIRENPNIPLPPNFPYLYNTETNRYVERRTALDQRRTVPTLRTRLARDYNLTDTGRIVLRRTTIYSNRIRYTRVYRPTRKNPNGVEKPGIMIVNTRTPLNITRFIAGDVPPKQEPTYGEADIPIITTDTVIPYTNNPMALASDAELQPQSSFFTIVEGSTSTEMVKTESDLKKIKMFNCKFMLESKNLSNFVDSGNMACVPETLYHLYCDPDNTDRHRIKKSVQDIARILDGSCDLDDGDVDIQQGYTVNDVRRFCEQFRIPMYACDSFNKVFETYIPERHNRHYKVLAFMIFGNHMYLYDNQKFKTKLAKSVQGSTCVCSDIVEKTKKKVEGDEVTDNDIIVDKNDLMEDVIEYFQETNKLLTNDSLTIVNGKITKMTKNGVNYYANTEADIVKNYIQHYNNTNDDKLTFQNQSVMNIARKIWKLTYPEHIKSCMNTQVSNHFKTNAGIVERWVLNDDTSNCYAIDINKCRTSCMRDNKLGRYKRFTSMDTIEPYDNTPLKEGFYYILTDNRLPARGNGWYSNGFIEYLKKENIEYKIKYQLIASDTYDEDYLMKIFNTLTTYDEYKFMVNGLIGSMAITKSTKSDMCFESDFETACHYFWNADRINYTVTGLKDEGKKQKILYQDGKVKKETFIRPVLYDDNDIPSLYSIEERNYLYMNENDKPIYNQILENEWIKCYELRKKMGGELLEIKTDCVSVRNPDRVLKCDDSVIGGYKEAEAYKIDWLYNKTNEESDIDFKDWNESFEEDYNGMEDIAKNILDTDRSCNIQGKGGVGKSYMLRHMVKELEKQNKKYAVLAPTNKAAINVNGSTIHKFLGVNDSMKVNPQMLRKVQSYDYLLIDEISLVGYKLLNIFQLLKQTTNIKLLFFGDLKRQLKPVGEEQYDYENSYMMKWLCSFNKVELTINKRSDDVMMKLSDDAFENGYINKTDFGNFELWKSKKHLCFTNRQRKQINDTIMRNKKENGLSIECDEADIKQNEYCQDVILHINTPIMSCKNNKKEEVVNNQEFVIENFDDEKIYVDDGREILIKDFHKNYIVSYAMTVHKSQAQTFDFKYSIWETEKFTDRMLYTALTRTTDKNNILIVES
jgi:DNA replication protein DnaC